MEKDLTEIEDIKCQIEKGTSINFASAKRIYKKDKRQFYICNERINKLAKITNAKIMTGYEINAELQNFFEAY